MPRNTIPCTEMASLLEPIRKLPKTSRSNHSHDNWTFPATPTTQQTFFFQKTDIYVFCFTKSQILKNYVSLLMFFKNIVTYEQKLKVFHIILRNDVQTYRILWKQCQESVFYPENNVCTLFTLILVVSESIKILTRFLVIMEYIVSLKFQDI